MTVPVKDAATVVLMRDNPLAPKGIETFLLQRAKTMAFAGGMTVFPGGGVDHRDRSVSEIPWEGPSPQWWARQFHTDAETASALVCAAIRETFEECGVLLADRVPEGAAADRAALIDKSLSFGQFLAKHQLSVRADLLRPLAHWITPLGERRRYDTRFFLAVLPEGQEADGETSEATHSVWSAPEVAIAAWHRGESLLLPPTWAQLTELTKYATAAEALAAERVITTIEPTLVVSGTEVVITYPGSEKYQQIPVQN